MTEHHIVTFLSDFGTADAYVAACELVIARLAPQLRVLHLCHSVPAGDINAGALLLSRLAPLGPPAVHLAVVDPGVGTDRHALCLVSARGDLLVGPDNGLLLPAARALGGVAQAYAISVAGLHELLGERAVRRLSRTFHGRDVFAPAAALLATGTRPAQLASELDPDRLTESTLPETVSEPGMVLAPVSEVDVFGNVQLLVSVAALRALARCSGAAHRPLLRCRAHTASGSGPWYEVPLVEVFADLVTGELGVLEDSWGAAAVVAGRSSAAAMLGVRLWDRIEFRGIEP